MAKKGLRAWVKEKWVDIGAPDGKGGYKPCGRKKGEKRKGYPKCVPLAKARKALNRFPGIKNININDSMEYPTPLDSSNKDNCLVGRLRKDYSVKHGLSLWVVGDQIRKGAALNAVQIAECLQKK